MRLHQRRAAARSAALCSLPLLAGGSAFLLTLCLGPARADQTSPPAATVLPEEQGWADLAFGVKLGAGFAQHVGTNPRNSEYDVKSEWRTGLTAGAYVYWPVTSRFGLQQEILYAQRGSQQKIGVEIFEVPTTLDVTYVTDYIDIPVLVRYAMFRWGQNDLYSLLGTAMSLKIHDRYTLDGVLDDGTEAIPLTADDDMSEVDMFDFSFVYGTGVEFMIASWCVLAEYRFTMGWNTLSMPTYAYVPFGDDLILVENEPVPLKNQSHALVLGIRF